jgi:hypothetical protein
LNNALAILDALELQHELLPDATGAPASALRLAVHAPFVPIVHVFELDNLWPELQKSVLERVDRPSHTEASRMAHEGALAVAHSNGFFADATQQQFVSDASGLIAREHILHEFKNKNMLAHRIVFNCSIAKSLTARKYSREDEVYALVEEAKLLLPNLADLLGVTKAH